MCSLTAIVRRQLLAAANDALQVAPDVQAISYAGDVFLGR
jgi:hypothetical protein